MGSYFLEFNLREQNFVKQYQFALEVQHSTRLFYSIKQIQRPGFGEEYSDLEELFEYIQYVVFSMYNDTTHVKSQYEDVYISLCRKFFDVLIKFDSDIVNTGNVKYVLESLLYFGFDKEVVEIVSAYYSKVSAFSKERIDKTFSHVDLDYPALYLKAANYWILNGDVDKGFAFYSLVAFNWGKHANKHTVIFKSENGEVKTTLGINILVRALFDIIHCVDSYSIQVVMRGNEYRDSLHQLWVKVIGHLQTYSDDDVNSIVHDVESFFEAFSKLQFEKLADSNEFLLIVAMAYILRKQCMTYVMMATTNLDLLANLDYNHLSCKTISKDWQLIFDYLLQLPKVKRVVVRDLARIAFLRDRIKFLLRVVENDLEIGHYTSLDTFMKILSSDDVDNIGKLCVMHVSYMNDPNEGRCLKKLLFKGKSLDYSLDRKNAEVPNVFVKCFSKKIDFLPMWNTYAKEATGCCIIPDWKRIAELKCRPVDKIYRVHYLHLNDDKSLSSDNEVDRYLDEIKNILPKSLSDEYVSVLDNILSDVSYLFKDSAYEYEGEIRIVYSFDDCIDKIRFVSEEEFAKAYVYSDFPLVFKEVILGPKFEKYEERMPYLQNEIQKYCNKLGVGMPKITFSEIEYR